MESLNGALTRVAFGIIPAVWHGGEREREVRRACLRCERTWNVAETNGLRKRCDIIDEIRVTLPLSINDASPRH